MKYSIGMVVILNDGASIYITGCDQKRKVYKGFDADNEDPQEEIEFSENEVLMRV